ncbi:hypothetical protein EYF80_052674 [Liparis tanakae]|uniref:Uncharacterized protein n=1 Tax=Liparis tanakae TaxID=230148 RepID=A0A4Z2F8K7_9TELE|nr:hypothetical protein EYF80_052674 [Liparis tanakae]
MMTRASHCDRSACLTSSRAWFWCSDNGEREELSRTFRGRAPQQGQRGVLPSLAASGVGRRVLLDRRDPKAPLHPLPRHAGAHPAAPERVEVGCEVGADVRVARPFASSSTSTSSTSSSAAVRAASDAVRQVERHLRATGRRADPLDRQGALRQAHRVPDPVVERVGELPVEDAGWVRAAVEPRDGEDGGGSPVQSLSLVTGGGNRSGGAAAA